MHTLQQRLRQVTQWLRDHRQQIIGVLCVFAALSIIHAVFAGNEAVASGGAKTHESLAETVGIALAQIIAWVSQIVVKLVVAVLEMLIIPILRYKSFTSSQIVGLGWAIVRDIVNMFFIVVLLIIAFQTIFGVGRADWTKQIPRLLLMAVVINFSRTICGLIIDFGQVVMITFVNAIKDIAGGNFISMFGLDKMYTFSEDAAQHGKDNDTGYGVWDLLGAAFLSLVISFIVLGTVLTMAMLFAFRIVLLWILIILSPLAFFLGGAKGVIGPAEGYYSNWWQRFTSAVSLGPIMTFFLWLALASAGAGTLADTQGFDTSTGTNGSDSIGLVTKIFDLPHFTSLVIALALLFAGIEVSQETASKIGGAAAGFAKSAVAGIPGLSKTLARIGAKGAVGLPAGAGLAIGRAGAQAYGMTPFLKGREEVGKFLGSVGAGISAVPVIGVAGRAMRNLGYSQVAAVEHKKEEARTEALKGLTGLGSGELKQLAGTPISRLTPFEEKNRIQAAQLKLVMDEKKRVALKPEELAGITEKIRDSGMVGDFDDATKDKFSRAVDAAPSLAAVYAKQRKPGETNEQYEERQQTEIDNRVRTILGSPAKMRTWGEDEKALSDPRVRKALRREKTRDGLTGEEYILAGKAGEKTADIWKKNEEEDFKKRRTEVQGVYANYAGAKQKRDQDIASITSDTAFQADPSLSATMKQEAERPLTAAIEKLTAAIGKLTENDLKAGVVTPEMLSDEGFFKAFTDPKQNKQLPKLATTNPALTAAMSEQLDQREARARESLTEEQAARQIAQLMTTRLNMGAAIPRAIDFDPTMGRFKDDTAEKAFKNMISEQPEMVLKIDGSEAAGAIGKAVSQAITSSKINELVDKIRRAPAQSTEQIQLISTLDRVAAALKNNYQALKDDTNMVGKIAAADRAKKRFGR